MHGHSPGSALLVNAEVDSMGGIVDGGISIDSKTSPRRAAIEKVQAELRQEFDVREERRRELEFLEKGGNPLDFKLGPAASISVQSTSFTDQLAEQCVISEAKGSFALAASPHGDSVDSSGRPGPTVGREPDTGDNLLLLEKENHVADTDLNSSLPSKRSKIAKSAKSSQLDGSRNAKETEESTIFRLVKSQAYARRNRSRPNRDGAHANSMNVVRSNHVKGTSFMVQSSRHDTTDAKGSTSEAPNEKEPVGSSICHSKTESPNANSGVKDIAFDNPLEMKVDAAQLHGSKPECVETRIEEGNDAKERGQNQCSLLRDQASGEAGLAHKTEQSCAGVESLNVTAQTKKYDNGSQPHGHDLSNLDFSDLQSQGQNDENDVSSKHVNSDSSCLDALASGVSCLKSKNSSYEYSKEIMVGSSGVPHVPSEVKEIKGPIAVQVNGVNKNDLETVEVKMEEETGKSESYMHAERQSDGTLDSESDRMLDVPLSNELNSGSILPESNNLISFKKNPINATSLGESANIAPEIKDDQAKNPRAGNQANEDAILDKARIIEANHKRLAELSVNSFHMEKCKKSHWDFVLEEMAWLANDFMQERLWKTAAAAQLSHGVAFSGRLKFNERNMLRKQKKVAHTIAKAVMEFWRSAEVLLNKIPKDETETVLSEPDNVNAIEGVKDKKTTNTSEEKDFCEESFLTIQAYALRFLKYINGSLYHPIHAEAPLTPDQIADIGILEMSWEDQLSEESLLYTVPLGAMENYRNSVESLWMEYEKLGSQMYQKEHELSLMDSVSEDGAQENPYEEEEGETGCYYQPGAFDATKSSKFFQKKKKHTQKSFPARLLGMAHDYGHYLEKRIGSQPGSTGKRLSSALNVGSIPTKRVRTAARQRIVGPLIPSGIPAAHTATKTDVSSGDTSSLQDDQSSLLGGSHLRKNSEVESTGEFGKLMHIDGLEMSPKARKKKAKHFGYRNSMNTVEFGEFAFSGKGSSFDQCFQADAVAYHGQRDFSKRKTDNHLFESNGNTGMYGPHIAKKPKLLKQLSDASFEASGPVSGSVPSAVTSHISNLTHPNKLIKIIANRAPGKKAKALKIISTAPSGSGSPWSVLEDQALVVLVHDMGPNWELVSDAMNSSLHFKSTFRKPKECKERHKILMDLRNAGDGAESAEDSGSSQAYPSTIPGIPKGSARQLFQRLQGPMEEDMLKSHFEKIIMIGQQLHARRIQNDHQEGKQLTPVHSSHFHALPQACSNSSNMVATPLDLCDSSSSSPDVLSPGYQGSHPNNVAVSSHQGPFGVGLPTTSSMIQGSSGMVLGNGLPPSPAASSPSPRDAHKYNMPRSASLSMEDKQRFQQYNQIISNRNVQQPAISSSGSMQLGNDRGVRMLPGGNGIGMTCGANRGMGVPRPGFQGLGSSTMLNMVSSGGMISPAGVGIPNPVNMNAAAVSGQGNSVLRPPDALAVMRPGQNAEEQRHSMIQELQVQVSQANGQGVSAHFNGLSTAYTCQTVPPPAQNFSVQHPPQHQISQKQHIMNNPHHPHLQGSNPSSPQQQAYAIRLATERQLQQRLMQQQQHQFPSNPSILHPQHSVSHVQNGPPSSGPPSLPLASAQHPLVPSSSPLNPVTSQVQPKHSHVLTRNPPGVVSNQMLKQRQRQQQLHHQQHPQQQQRPHPQSRQSQSQQQAKHLKGLGSGGSLMMHQSLPMDPTHINGLLPGNQVSEKGEPPIHLMQGQGLYSGGNAGSNLAQSGKQLGPQSPNPGPQHQKLYSCLATKQLPLTPTHTDVSSQSQTPQISPNHSLLSTQQSVASSPLARQTSQTQQSIQRILPHNNRQAGSSDAPLQGPTDQVLLNQMSASPIVSQCMDAPSSGPTVNTNATSPQWKTEPTLS